MTWGCPRPPPREEEVELELRGAPAGSSMTWGDNARAVEEEEELGTLSESGWTWTSSED